MNQPSRPEQPESRSLSNRDLIRFLIGLVVFLICFFLVAYIVAVVLRSLR